MCVIAIATTKRAKLEDLRLMEKHNPDGAGMAWIQGGEVRFIKGAKLSADKLFQMARGIPLPIIYHFRIATVGAVKDELCHPFPVMKDVPPMTSGKVPAVLFHNGTVGEWKEYIKGLISRKTRHGWKIPQKGLWSDSRAVALLALEHGPEVLEFFSDMNRFVYLDKKGFKAYGDWEKYEGLSVSNTWFEPIKPYVYTPPAGGYSPYAGPTTQGLFGDDPDYYDDEYWKAFAKDEVTPKKGVASKEVVTFPREDDDQVIRIEAHPGPGMVWDEELKGYVTFAMFDARRDMRVAGLR